MIVVIGGGWAGCAAAVELAERAHRVELHEAAPVVGGRARSVTRDGLTLDNGEHLLLGAYRETLALAARLREGAATTPWIRAPLALRPFAPAQGDAVTLSTRAAPASLGLLAALARARGLGWRERAATIRWFNRQRRAGYRCDPQATVAVLLAGLPARVRDGVLRPICIAALNTAPERASGQVFLNVLRQTFGAGTHATELVMPRTGLGEAIPEAAARWLVACGHRVRTSTRSRIAAIDGDCVAVETAGATMRADAVVVAVGPHQLAAAFAPGVAQAHAPIAKALDAVARFDYEPITTLYLGYAGPVALGDGLVRLDDAPGQWLFDRGDILRRAAPSPGRPAMDALLSVVISAGGAHEALDHRALAAAADAQLRRLAPDLPALVWSQVIDERRATYACVPALERPACGALAGPVHLAGDYTDAELPATLEAAVRSGLAAARAVG